MEKNEATAAMCMIESASGKINWECSNCHALLKDRARFEEKVKKCPKCGAVVAKFYSLFDDDEESGNG